MNKLNECDLRRSIMKRKDLTPATKLCLLALLLKVDWQTWQGPATVVELIDLAGLSRRAVQTALKSLTDANIIARSWGQVGERKLPIVAINIHALTGAQNMHRAKSAPRKICTGGAQNMHTGGAESAQECAKSAPLQYNNNNNIDLQLKESTSDRPQSLAHKAIDLEFRIETSQNTSLPKAQHKLTTDMINIIESHAKYSGHAERVAVAREHLNIKLLKGGYYEQL